MGAQIHFFDSYSDSQYEQWLKYTGLRAFRGAGEGGIANSVNVCKATGAKALWSAGAGPTETTSSLQARLTNEAVTIANAKIPAGLPNAGQSCLSGLEGVNEPGNFPATYNGASCAGGGDWTACAKIQHDLYAFAKADPTLKNFPVVNVSEIGQEGSNACLQFMNPGTTPGSTGCPVTGQLWDLANTHGYYRNDPSKLEDNAAWDSMSPTDQGKSQNGYIGDYITTWYRQYAGYSTSAFPAVPRVQTENGWSSNAPSADQQGKYIVNLYLSAWKEGASQLYVYKLIDDSAEATPWGMYDGSGNAKAAAVYVHNLTTILADTANFTPGQLNYSIASPPSTVHDLLLQKADGSFWIVVWDDKPVGGSTDNVTVDLGGTYTVTTFDPIVGTSGTAKGSVSSVTLALSDHAQILQVK